MKHEHWEEDLQAVARSLAYPSTPDVRSAVAAQLSESNRSRQMLPRRMSRPTSSRRISLHPVWSVVVMLMILIGGLWSVPQVRAAVREWLQIGAVRIWLVEPTPTATLPAAAPPAVTPVATPISPTVAAILTEQPTATPAASVLELWGEQTLDEAQTMVNFPIRLPTYPPDLGSPDHVFVQQMNGDFVVLVWTDPNDPTSVEQVLYQIEPAVGLNKGGPIQLRETTVHGQPAAWVMRNHYLRTEDGNFSTVRGIGQDVLLWTEIVDGQEITYRLETDLSEEEAVRVAESLKDFSHNPPDDE